MSVILLNTNLDAVTRGIVAHACWAWFEANKNLTIVKKKLLFFTVEVRVEHLRELFVRLFGTQPESSKGL